MKVLDQIAPSETMWAASDVCIARHPWAAAFIDTRMQVQSSGLAYLEHAEFETEKGDQAVAAPPKPRSPTSSRR